MECFRDNSNLMSALKISGQFFAVWPLDSKVGRPGLVFFRTLWWIYFVNCFVVLATIVVGINCCYFNLKELMKSLMEGTYMLEALFNITYFRWREREFRRILSEMERFDQIASSQEKFLKRNCLKRTQMIYSVIPTMFAVGCLIFFSAPLIMPQRIIPLNTVYFGIPVDETWGWGVVYTLNVFTVTQATVAIMVDLVVVAIIWHATYKFTFVGVKMRTLVDKHLRKSVALHQDAIRFAEEVQHALSPIVTKSIAAVSVHMITCSLLVLNNVPMFEITQFFLVAFISSMRLFVSSWSAEIMTQTAYDISWTLYNGPWTETTPKLKKNILFIIQRSQKPIIIHAGGVIPALCLRFFTSVLQSVFSLFMTLRAILIV